MTKNSNSVGCCANASEANKKTDGTSTTLSPSVNSVARLTSNFGFQLEEKKKEKIRKFVSENFKHAECNCYIPLPSDETGICGCGREHEWHKKMELLRGSTPWSTKEHIKKLNPSHFGTVKFVGFGSSQIDEAKYVRVYFDEKQLEDQTTQNVVKNVDELIKSCWEVPPPRLVISVTGGAKDLNLDPTLKRNFKRVLIRTATSTGAWIVTGGYKEAIMQLVGEAVHEHNIIQTASSKRIVALGIGTWGVCDNKKALDGANKAPVGANDHADTQIGKFPAEYRAEDLQKRMEDGIASLDPNHTHFILVDDGTEKQSGKEIKFRAAFENYVTGRKVGGTNTEDNRKSKVPIFCLMVNGGTNSLEMALEVVNNDCPLVVARGSGRMADIVAKACVDNNEIDAKLIEQGLPDVDKVKYAAIIEDLKTLKNNKQVFAFSLDDNDDSQMEVILKALLEGPARDDLVTQLKMTLAFNMSAVARRDIF